MSYADHAFDWNDLLDCIDSKDRCVIPIVGRELLTVSVGGEEVLLERYLAERLADKLEVRKESLDENLDLKAVANAYLRQPYADSGRIYRALNAIMGEAERRFVTPPSLAKLAEITGFALFVTTTFDSLLVQALNEQRPGRVLESYSASRQHPDIPEDWKDGGLVPAHYLFGKFSSLEREYAVTEEDYLEFIADMQSGKERPKNLFDAFRENHLLFLGCGFENWLERFFIRTVRDQRFTPSSRGLQVVADREAGRGGSLTVFLQLYRMQVFREDGPIRFVDRLYEHWRERHPKTTSSQAPPQPSAVEQPFQIFLSYDHRDAAAAQGIRDELARAGLRVWFDKAPESIPPGEDWNRLIGRKIRDCTVFMPVLSQHALSRPKSYLIQEWKTAIEENKSRLTSARFLQPLSLDDTQPGNEVIDENFPEFQQRQWARITDGQLDPNFIDDLIDLLRKLKEKEMGTRR